MNETEETRTAKKLIIYCSDTRVDLWKRIKKHLIPAGEWWQPLGFLGGAISLAHSEHLPLEYAVLMVKQIPFAIRKFPTIKEVVLVGHDCGYYEDIPRGMNFTVEDKEKDLRKAAALLRRHFPNMKVSAFFAEKKDSEFKRIKCRRTKQ
ncbi:MAG: hypothetical protein NTY04_00300 [Candidatus Staskawiczbacteria bacterium]|nr:hypothetical protein [Candidatus Staskawiczbacteria bacterium]